ncbi:MAG: hypothetical protein Pars2KO_19570 [Parasphingorhabdus sp.]
MKLALISLTKDMPDDLGPIGLFPLFDGLVLDQQINSVKSTGAEKIILISPTMNGGILRYVDMMQGKGEDVEIVRSGHDLVQFASPENDIIFLGDGILPDKYLLERMTGTTEELIFVTADSQAVTEFERIDRNDRWLGIAKLNGSRLSGFIDLPEEWDVGSALLRGAVQSECARECVESSDLESGAVSNLTNKTEVLHFSQRHLQEVQRGGSNFLVKLVAWPTTRAILPLLWKAPAAYNYLGWASFVSAIFAFGFAFFDLPSAFSVSWLILSLAFQYFRKNIRIFSKAADRFDMFSIIICIVSSTTLLTIVYWNSVRASILANLVIFALGFGYMWLSQQIDRESKWDLLKPEPGLLLIILLIFSAFGSFMIGIYVIALTSMIYLFTKKFEWV